MRAYHGHQFGCFWFHFENFYIIQALQLLSEKLILFSEKEDDDDEKKRSQHKLKTITQSVMLKMGHKAIKSNITRCEPRCEHWRQKLLLSCVCPRARAPVCVCMLGRCCCCATIYLYIFDQSIKSVWCCCYRKCTLTRTQIHEQQSINNGAVRAGDMLYVIAGVLSSLLTPKCAHFHTNICTHIARALPYRRIIDMYMRARVRIYIYTFGCRCNISTCVLRVHHKNLN